MPGVPAGLTVRLALGLGRDSPVARLPGKDASSLLIVLDGRESWCPNVNVIKPPSRGVRGMTVYRLDAFSLMVGEPKDPLGEWPGMKLRGGGRSGSRTVGSRSAICEMASNGGGDLAAFSGGSCAKASSYLPSAPGVTWI